MSEVHTYDERDKVWMTTWTANPQMKFEFTVKAAEAGLNVATALRELIERVNSGDIKLKG